ncbi:MAG: (deoxy)nucleoside triphosphate pyrophosphohydrolase [Butyrivibrio sp.]|nr:(deoxy)nucleoside triphosphate pyrophosphohydrolase [Butyrivibrio sp.]
MKIVIIWEKEAFMETSRKTINVVAALIRDGKKVFATARGYGNYKGWWEFPGGKVEPGESPEGALVREIREELDSEISVDEYISTIEYDYPEFHLSMRCYWCSLISGDLVLKEAEDAKWLDVETIDSVKWLPADITLIDEIKKRMA